MRFLVEIETGNAPNQGMLMRALEHSLNVMIQKGYLEEYDFGQSNKLDGPKRDFWDDI